jgi:hypothetical protein
MFSDREEDSLGVLLPPLAALRAWLRRADIGQMIAAGQLFREETWVSSALAAAPITSTY